MLVAIACVLGACGCATHKSATAAADDEWVTLPPVTGSNVPRRVRRSELANQSGVSNVDAISGSALMNSVRPNGPPPGVRGN